MPRACELAKNMSVLFFFPLKTFFFFKLACVFGVRVTHLHTVFTCQWSTHCQPRFPRAAHTVASSTSAWWTFSAWGVCLCLPPPQASLQLIERHSHLPHPVCTTNIHLHLTVSNSGSFVFTYRSPWSILFTSQLCLHSPTLLSCWDIQPPNKFIILCIT